ncbi:hypothetical protein DQ405_019320 [Pseudomonas sp. SST3]|nr:hypothetical protein [Pseudomonas sp. SST3]
MLGRTNTASRLPPIRNTPSSTRLTAVRADRRLGGGLRYGQLNAGARAARPVSRLAGRHSAARQPGSDGLSVLLAGQVAAHYANRLSHRWRHRAGGGHAGTWHCHDLGCRRADLGGQPDRGGARRGPISITPDASYAVRDPAFHRARGVAARLPATQGRSGSPAVDHGRHVDSRDDRAATAPLLLDQRVEGAGRRPRRAAGHRADLAGLVLRRRAGRRSGADHRPGVLPAHRRHRALAVPPGAQAWWQAAGWLAVRFPASAPQVRQHGEAPRLRLRPARSGDATVAARLRARHRADSGEQHGAADVPTRVGHGTGVSAGKPVDGLVLSGVRGIVLSGVSLSCYQACEILCRPETARPSASLNFSNLKALTFCRSTPFRWVTSKRHGQTFSMRRAES